MARLDNAEFAELKKLQKLSKAKKLDEKGEARLAELLAKKTAGNDPEDYCPTEQCKHDLAEFYQNDLQGMPVVASNMNVAIGGICVLTYHKVVDSVASHVSGITLAARDLYQWIRSGQSGATNYQGVDIELFIQGVAEIVDWIDQFKRLYRLANTYDRLNVVWPVKIFYALTGSYTLLPELVRNLADFRSRINNLCRMVSSFNFPGDLPFMRVRRHLASNVFIEDKDNTRTQVFIYKPGSILSYNETKYTTGGCLERQAVNWTSLTTYYGLTLLMDKVEAMIATFKASNTNTTMNGDIYRKYEHENMTDKLFVFSELHDLETLVPLYDEHILERIRHTTVTQDNLQFGDIVQKDNCIFAMIFGPMCYTKGSQAGPLWQTDFNGCIKVNPDPNVQNPTTADYDALVTAYAKSPREIRDFGYNNVDPAYLMTSQFLNFDKVPDVNMNIEATRHTVLCGGYSVIDNPGLGADVYNPVLTHGSEIVYSVEFFTSDDMVKVNWLTTDDWSAPILNASDPIVASHFKYRPILHIASLQARVPQSPQIEFVDTELECFGKLEYSALRTLNKQALITEFSSASVTGMMSRLTGK